MSIQSEINRLKGVKTDIRNAIISKGVEIPEETPFLEYANKIAEIDTATSSMISLTITNVGLIRYTSVYYIEYGSVQEQQMSTTGDNVISIPSGQLITVYGVPRIISTGYTWNVEVMGEAFVCASVENTCTFLPMGDCQVTVSFGR